MKILYAVQATGNGHITRARVMAAALKNSAIQVDWLFTGRPASELFDMEIFGDFHCKRGLTFVFENGRINYWKTIRKNSLWQLWQDIRDIDLSAYDLIINDFEPISAWAARRAQKYVIGLSHQCAFYYDIPKPKRSFFFDCFMQWFAPVSLPIGVHWCSFDGLIVPPVIEHNHQTTSITKDSFVFYFPFLTLQQICNLLLPFSHATFHVFYGVDKPEVRGNIHIHPFSRTNFQHHLLHCEGVITAAGFELPSEAILLGKKLLVQAIKGQTEQQANAEALAQLKYATVTNQFDQGSLLQWMQQQQPQPVLFPDVAPALVRWLEQGDYSSITELVRQLWQTGNSNTRNTETQKSRQATHLTGLSAP